MSDVIRIVCLGGQDEIYKNMTCVEINNDIFVIEAGIKFPDKTKPGIDYIIPKFDYLLANKDRIRGYFLTHGHDSMIGALPYIIDKIPAPIFCTDLTKEFLLGFCNHNSLDSSKFVFNLVEPNDDLLVAGRKIQLFSTCSSFAKSFGISIPTDQGNIIYISNNIIDNNLDKGFTFNGRRLSEIAESSTLALLCDSIYAQRPGYTNPDNRVLSQIAKYISNAPGRVFVALDAPDQYNIVSVIYFAIKMHRKLVVYDATTKETIVNLIKTGQLSLKKENLASMDDVNRIRAQELLILMVGFEKGLQSKISLLAKHQNDNRILFLNDTDTFINAAHKTNENELSITNALDELHRNNCKIIAINQTKFLRTHASEEDIKTLISVIQPKNYIPVSGSFKLLLANAKIALDTNVGLNHTNVFIIDNGQVLTFNDKKGKILDQKVIAGDAMVDGQSVGEISNQILENRQRLADDGVVILAATISKSKRKIMYGPDIQTRGLIYVKENNSLMNELYRVFILNINNEIAKEAYSIPAIERSVKDSVFRAVRRATLKTPIIIPIICEIE